MLGPLYNGGDAFDFFRPSLLNLAATLSAAESAAGKTPASPKWEDALPLPTGMRLYRRLRDHMPLLSLGPTHALRFRRIYGFVGEIKYVKDEPSGVICFESPAMLAIIVRLWWKYGTLRQEARDSWIYCRMLAYASTALFDGQLEIIRVGDPISE